MRAGPVSQVTALLAVLLLGVVIGYGLSAWRESKTSRLASPTVTQPAGRATGKGRTPLYWYDPMYPQQKFDKPGKSPFMDMQLVAKYAEDENEAGVRIDPALSQNLGIRVAPVERQTLSANTTAVATVMFNDRDVAVVQARTGGFVERVYARAPGDVIAAGAPLADVLVSEWAGAQEEFLAVRSTGESELTAAARRRLLLLGMTQAQIEALERSGEPRAVMTIASPIAGVIQELGIRAGMSVSPGMTLARVNGLRTVWVEAAVPEAQTASLEVGRTVIASFAAYPGKQFEGRVAAVLPEANMQTRTLRVRMEFANPQEQLKPGMFAQVHIAGPKEAALMVPSEAVIRTGKRSIVFVAQQPGRYVPVDVEVGTETDGKLVVLGGLTAGQQVVVSGQFLIDSEASLRGVTDRMGASTEAGISDPRATLHEGLGTITQLSRDSVTLSHGPIPSMQWGAMTMPFRLAKPATAPGLKVGERVRFRFRQRDDDFVIESIAPAGAEK